MSILTVIAREFEGSGHGKSFVFHYADALGPEEVARLRRSLPPSATLKMELRDAAELTLSVTNFDRLEPDSAVARVVIEIDPSTMMIYRYQLDRPAGTWRVRGKTLTGIT